MSMRLDCGSMLMCFCSLFLCVLCASCRARAFLRHSDFDRRQQASEDQRVPQVSLQEDRGAQEAAAQEARDGTGSRGSRGGGCSAFRITRRLAARILPARQQQGQPGGLGQQRHAAVANGVGGHAAATTAATTTSIIVLAAATTRSARATRRFSILGAQGVVVRLGCLASTGEQQQQRHEQSAESHAVVSFCCQCCTEEAIVASPALFALVAVASSAFCFFALTAAVAPVQFGFLVAYILLPFLTYRRRSPLD